MHITPAKIILLFFLITILTGTILLLLPISLAQPCNNKFIDALFTATSSVCVTGLTTVEIGTYYTLFGQIIIMILIQIGGLGYMTLGSLLILFTGKLTLKNKLVVHETAEILSYENIIYFLKHVIKITVVVELLGTIVLTLSFIQYPLMNKSILKSFYYGLFHSISAFNNSGLSLFNDSLIKFNQNIFVLITMGILIIFGGIGYFVIIDLYRSRLRFNNCSLHTKIVLLTTAGLVVFGTFLIFVLENNNIQTIGSQGTGYKLLNSFFTSVTPRTAGFNSLIMSNLMPSTILLLMILMFIGASPASTGGGIKTTTFAVLLKTFFSTIKGNQEINIYNRRLDLEAIKKSMSITTGFLFVVTFICSLLLITEKQTIVPVLFETVSAIGTVGLSLGITPYLSTIGKLLIILTMLVGRIGPLTIGIALFQSDDNIELKYPEEKIMVG